MEAAVSSEEGENLRQQQHRDMRVAVLLLAGIALALALRAARLDFQPLWWDEGYSAWFATHSLPQMARLTAEDIHPPLYYALLHLWTRLVGPGPVSLRLLSVVFGVLAIPVIYMVALRILGSRRAAAIAALLLAFNPLHIYYSQEVRMYGLVALLSAGILWAAWEVLRGDWRPRGPQFAYVALVNLALYTQYYAVFLPIGMTLYAMWRWRKDARALARWFALQLIAALLYLPWVIYAAPRLTLYVSQKVVQDADKPLGPLAYAARHLAAYTVGHLEGPLTPWWPLALALLLPILAGLMVARHSLQRPRQNAPGAAPDPVAFLATVLATVLLLGWLIGLRYPFFPDRGERLLLLGLPAFVMLVAAGITGLSARRYLSRFRNLTGLAFATALGFVLASALSLGLFYTVPRYPEDDYRPLIARSVEQGLPGDTVLAVYPWQVGYWRSYAAGVDGPTAILTPSAAWNGEVAAALDKALARGHLWFPAHLSLGAILETEIERQLGQRAAPFVNTWYGAGTRLSAWSRHDADGLSASSTPILAEYDYAGGSFSLGEHPGWEQPVSAANQVVPLALRWSANAAPPDLAVSVRLVDNLGHIWGQNDYEPLGGMVGSDGAQANGTWVAVDQLGLLIPAGTPPGRYRAELVLSTQDSATLSARAGDRIVQGVPLLPLEVAPADRLLGPERLPIATRSESQLNDGIRFFGYTVDNTPLAPGATRRVNLFWQATGQPSADYTAFVQGLGRDGAPAAGWEAPPGAAYPTSQWTPGTLIRTQAEIRFPAGTGDGRYPLIAGLYNPTDGRRLKTERGAEQLSMGAIVIKGRPHEMSAPAPQVRSDASFGNVARLVGYDRDEVALTGPLTITLHWQALGASDLPLTVFVHLLDEQGNVIGYGDSEPGNGAYPTTGWLQGEYLADRHTVTFAPDALKVGKPRLAIGLYDPTTGERLLTSDGQDQFVIELEG
jgi:4-amino-4-deoxy-L-arabinose transferase-like glycosyltransferase